MSKLSSFVRKQLSKTDVDEKIKKEAKSMLNDIKEDVKQELRDEVLNIKEDLKKEVKEELEGIIRKTIKRFFGWCSHKIKSVKTLF